MAAFYHLLTPFEISIKDDPALVQQFDERYGADFKFKTSDRIERFSPPQGKRMKTAHFFRNNPILLLENKNNGNRKFVRWTFGSSE